MAARLLMGYITGHDLFTDVEEDGFGVANADLILYVQLKRNTRSHWVSVGGATTHGDVLGTNCSASKTNNGLRGFVENRFAGTSTAYFNTELRYQLFQTLTSIVPIKVGVKAFYDYGRVFSDASMNKPAEVASGLSDAIFYAT
ncbi:MAG: hypothetical protein R2788_21565 [Saprospiraceae bacterium]